MGEDVLEAYPDERGQEINEGRKGLLYARKTPGKNGPKQGKVTNENSINSEADPDGEIAVVGGHRRNPINQDGIEGNASVKSEKKGLFRCFFMESKKKRDKGDPTQKGKIEFGER
jgi:hypothetical protein